MQFKTPTGHPPSVALILREVAEFWNVSVADILSRKRCRFGRRRRPTFFIEARHSAMRRCRDEVVICGRQASFPQIGRWFGRDHTTVLYAYYGTQRGRNSPRAGTVPQEHREAA